MKFQPPTQAKRNAQRVLAWRKKYGENVEGMTRVGWTRARQLASGKPISADIVKRMAQFARHEENYLKAQAESPTEPWREAAIVAWLGWGGTSGIEWAKKESAKMRKKNPAKKYTGKVVPVTEARKGQYIIEHGSIFKLKEKEQSKAHPLDEFGPTVWFETEYVGPAFDDLIESIPSHWRSHERPWVVQGNKLRSVYVIPASQVKKKPAARKSNPKKRTTKKRVTKKKTASKPAKLFTKAQIAKLKAHYGKIKSIDPADDAYKKMRAYVDRLPLPLLRQLKNERVPWLGSLATNTITRRTRGKK